MINSLYDFEKLIKVNGPAYRGAKMPTTVDVAINESNIPDNMRLKHYRVDILDENSIQIYWQTQEPFTTDDAEKALEEIKRAVNTIVKANDYTERVNVFVTFECRDGADEGYEDFTFVVNDETKKENINIRESLNRLDAETCNKYDLLNTYDANPLNESKKQTLAKMLNENKNAKSIYKFLNEAMHYPPEGGAMNLNKKEKRYPLWLYDKLEKAVANIDEIPEEHKEQFITLVGDRATTKNIPRIGYKAALLPKSLSTKFKKDGDADYMAAKDYNSLIARPEYYGTTIEEALIAIYEAMKNRWFKDSVDESIDDDFDWSIYDDDYGYDDYEDDWEDSNLYGGDLTYCPVCNKSLSHDENGDSYCPECGESAFWLAQKRREMDKDLDETFSYEDDEFFTREEVDDFAEKVCDHINETFNEVFKVQESYITNNEIEVVVYNDELGEFTGKKKVDMRRIRKPSDLDKYVLDIAADIIEEIKEVLIDSDYHDADEDELRAMGAFGDDLDEALTEDHITNTYKGFEMDWNTDSVDPEEESVQIRVRIIDRKGKHVATVNGFRAARKWIDENEIKYNKEPLTFEEKCNLLIDYYSKKNKEDLIERTRLNGLKITDGRDIDAYYLAPYAFISDFINLSSLVCYGIRNDSIKSILKRDKNGNITKSIDIDKLVSDNSHGFSPEQIKAIKDEIERMKTTDAAKIFSFLKTGDSYNPFFKHGGGWRSFIDFVKTFGVIQDMDASSKTALIESVTEDSDDDEPYSYKETEAELQSLTQNWTIEKDQLKCGYDEEKNYGMEILSKHGYECKADRQGGWWIVDYWKESLEESAKTWNDAYKEFQTIVDKYFPNEDEIESKVYDLYMANRLDPAYEEAYERWLDSNGESDTNLDEDKESSSFKYDIEKLSNLGKYFNVTVSMFGDKLQVEGTAKDKNKFYEVAEEKGLLPETELSEDFKDDVTVKSLITDDRLSIVETDVIPNTTSFIAEYIEGDSQGTRFLFVLADDKGTEYTQNRTGEDSINTPTEILEINGEDNVYFIFDLDSSTLGEAWSWEPEFKTEDGWTEEDIARWKEIDWEPLLKQHIGEVAVPEDNFLGKAVLYGDGYKPQYKQVKFVKKLHSNPIYPPNYEPEENPFPEHCGPMYDGTKHNGLMVHDRYETWANYDMLSK